MGYINGIGIISSQETSGPGFLPDVKEYVADFLHVINPDYKQYINPISARRMSRLIKMGITSARMAMNDAGLDMPDAIITGTGLGSVEDTEKLLAEIKSAQNILNPTPFIQSTYNTISSQVAISLKCHNYNSTYVHRALSFESAMLDGLFQLEEGTADHILAGGIDEMTLVHLNIIRRLGHWKREPASNLRLLDYETPGALAGEGAVFMVAGKQRTDHTYCSIPGIKTFYKPGSSEEIHQQIERFLANHGTDREDIDLVIMGYNGDRHFDPVYDEVYSALFPRKASAWFKHLSGEYYTASAVAVWLGANILKRREIPAAVRMNDKDPGKLRNILIYNQYRNENHSLVLLSAV